MARRRRAVVPQLRQRELGLRWRGPDAHAHRQHQRPGHCGVRAPVPLARRPAPGRPCRPHRAGVVMVASNTIYASDVAFSDTVKAIQARKGSRAAYARMEAGGSWEHAITADLKAEIEVQTSVFLATANSQGQPYIQHRGGPAGFLRV